MNHFQKTIRAYLKEMGTNVRLFAQEVGVVPATFRRYIKGTRNPDDTVKLRICKATAWRIKPCDFFEEGKEHCFDGEGCSCKEIYEVQTN